jgi:putative addiction module CopG family antidote
MRRTTSFTLGSEQHAFIEQQLKRGTYASSSELVRAAVSALAEETQKETLFRAAIDRGLASVRAKPGVFARVRKHR